MFRARNLAPCAALAFLVLLGCNAPKVRRFDEIGRFRNEMNSRLASLYINPAVPLTMDRCVEIALENNLDYSVRQLLLRIQDEKVRIAMSAMLPQGQLNYTATRRNNKSLVEQGPDTVEMVDQNLRTFSLSAVVPILDWGATRYAYQVAKDKRTRERLLVTRTEQTLTRDVQVAYAQLAALERQERLMRVALLAARELLKVAQSIEREGLGARADTAQVEAGLAEAAVQWSNLRRGCEQARLALAQLMSLPPGTAFTIDPALPAVKPLVKQAEILKLENSALQARPELHVQDLERHIAANTVRQRFAEMLPQLDGLGSFNWSSQSGVVNPSFFMGGIQITNSLLQGGAQLWSWREAKDTVSVEEERALLLALGVLYDVDFRVLQLFTAYDAMVAAHATVRAQQEALKQAVSRYVEGLETGTDTIRSLAQTYLSRLQLDRVQTDYQVGWYELEAAALPGVPKPKAPVEGEPAEAPLPVFEPGPALDTLQQMLNALPPVDLRQYPELEEVLKRAEKRKAQP